MLRLGNTLCKRHYIYAPRRFLSLNSEMKLLKEDLQKKGANEGKLLFYTILFPSLVGAGIGSCVGFIEGYNMSKKNDFYNNYYSSMGGFCSGVFMGAACGIFWPLSITVGALRFYEKYK